MTFPRGYVSVRTGQIHYVEKASVREEPTHASTTRMHAALNAEHATPRSALATPPAPRAAVPLYCLHATAYSGSTFLPLMRALDNDRRVLALDTPGYGGSDRPARPLTIDGYADAIVDAIERTRGDAEKVDLFGYHTGAALAISIAARYPDLVGRVVLLGIPFFRGDDHARWYRQLVHPHRLEKSLTQFAERWDYLVTRRQTGVSLARAFSFFVDELRSYPHDATVHQALFQHDLATQLPHVGAPVCVLNPDVPLAPYSRDAAACMPHACVVTLPTLRSHPLECGAEVLARETVAFLTDPLAESSAASRTGSNTGAHIDAHV